MKVIRLAHPIRKYPSSRNEDNIIDEIRNYQELRRVNAVGHIAEILKYIDKEF